MNYTLRTANQSDQTKIRSLIHQVKINPLSLDWRRFVVAVNSVGEIVGCGQVKQHSDDTRELASIAVMADYRRQGIARAIIQHLINVHPQPLYLTCRNELESFYQPYGFITLSENEMPPYFRRLKRYTGIFFKLTNHKEKLLVMQYQG